MIVQPYIYLAGRSEEAIAFYESAVGARRQMVMRFSEAPDQPPEGMLADGWGEKVMHAAIEIGSSLLMLSDGCGTEEPGIRGFSLALTVKDPAEAERAFAALAEGGQISMRLGKTFFSPAFGMLADRFGVNWTVVTEA